MESIEIAFAIVAIIGLGVAGVLVCGGWQVAKYAARMWPNRDHAQAR